MLVILYLIKNWLFTKKCKDISLIYKKEIDDFMYIQNKIMYLNYAENYHKLSKEYNFKYED